jgi:hypothetical protein
MASKNVATCNPKKSGPEKAYAAGRLRGISKLLQKFQQLERGPLIVCHAAKYSAMHPDTSISVHMLCPEQSSLLQHYEATLRRWGLAEWSSTINEPDALLRVSEGIEKKKALDERDAARERLNLHERTCPTCIHNQHNPHSVK